MDAGFGLLNWTRWKMGLLTVLLFLFNANPDSLSFSLLQCLSLSLSLCFISFSLFLAHSCWVNQIFAYTYYKFHPVFFLIVKKRDI